MGIGGSKASMAVCKRCRLAMSWRGRAGPATADEFQWFSGLGGKESTGRDGPFGP